MHDATPAEAVELYLDERETEDVAALTLQSHRSRLSFFIEWCEGEGNIESMQDVTGLDIHKWRSWRSKQISKVTLKTHLDTLRVFLRFCERLELVDEGLADKVDSIALSRGEDARDVMLEADTAREMLDHLEKFKYGTRQHVQLAVAWHTGARLGALRALDVRDYHAADQYLSIRHRPETETPLKNGREGERDIAVSDSITRLLDDWLETQRPEVTDEYGREPLLATDNGRVSVGTIRRTTYAWTRPCEIGLGCPHGRDENDCEATLYGKSYTCPSSVSPHPVRRGAITHWLRRGVDEHTVSGRMDVSPDVIDAHYDGRTEREKMETRRRFLEVVDDR